MTDWDGAGYRRVNTLQQWLAARALEDVDVTGVHRLLDVGCGDGRVTQALAARAPAARVVGIDPSPRMIAVAEGDDRLRFEVGSVEAMAFHAEFDLVVSFNALHWVQDQRSAYANIARALEPGGRAVLVFVCDGARPSLEDIATTTATSPAWATTFPGFRAPFVHPDPEQWQREVAGDGLAVTEIRVDDLTWDFGTREAFTAWCTVGFGAWTDGLPESDRGRFVTEVVDAYASEWGSDREFHFRQLVGKLTRPAGSV